MANADRWTLRFQRCDMTSLVEEKISGLLLVRRFYFGDTIPSWCCVLLGVIPDGDCEVKLYLRGYERSLGFLQHNRMYPPMPNNCPLFTYLVQFGPIKFFADRKVDTFRCIFLGSPYVQKR